MRTIHDIIHRIRAEYVEMPGLQLSAAQLEEATRNVFDQITCSPCAIGSSSDTDSGRRM